MGVMPSTTDLRQRFADARLRTDELFTLVRPDSLFERPVPERHRLNFYIGHVEAFDWNMISTCELGPKSFHAEFDRLFAFGIDPDSDSLPSDQPADWPSLPETAAYCRRVRETVDSVLDQVPDDVAQTCIEHRLMHAETICYLLHNLAPELLLAEPASKSAAAADCGEVPQQWIHIPAGEARLGRDRGSGFGWDNEFGARTEDVDEYWVRKYKVTNAEYVAFVDEGGPQPHYWRKAGNSWLLRTMFGEVPLPLDWPVYVTHSQAAAFAEHAGASLPSEAQWDRAAYGSGDPSRRFPWGNGCAPDGCANLDFRSWDPCSVLATPACDSAFGISQLLGNGWEWTCNKLRPFPGFEEYDFYPAYSSAFFDEEHYVLKGGSQRTALQLARRSFRNWFRQDYPYVYSTFRLARQG